MTGLVGAAEARKLLEGSPVGDWFDFHEAKGMIEYHGVDPDRIDSDAELIAAAPRLAATVCRQGESLNTIRVLASFNAACERVRGDFSRERGWLNVLAIIGQVEGEA